MSRTTGATGAQGVISDMPLGATASTTSNGDYQELLKTHFPSTANVAGVALFDKTDARPVTGIHSSFAPFDAEQVRSLIDVFTTLGAPAAADYGASDITLGDKTYKVSGPRGGQHPLEMAVLHADDEMLFATTTAQLLVLVKPSEEASTLEKTPGKESVWTAIRSFTNGLTQKGL